MRYAALLFLASVPAFAQFGNATRIQGQAVKAPLSCSDTFVLTWVAANSRFECLAGGGGSSAFSAITTATNIQAAMVVGTGASLGTSGSGTINATSLGGNAAVTYAPKASPTFSGTVGIINGYSFSAVDGGFHMTDPTTNFLQGDSSNSSGYGFEIYAGDSIGNGFVTEARSDTTSGTAPMLLQGYFRGSTLPGATRPFIHSTAFANNALGSGGSTTYQNLMLWCHDTDFAIDSPFGGGPFPCGLAIYGAEDGSTFTGGYSTIGEYVGINTSTAPAETFHVNSMIAARPVVAIQAHASQSANLFQTLASDGATVLDAFGATGQLLLNADITLPTKFAKITQAATAPGAGFCTERWEVGTNAGTGKLVAYCGTSATGVTIVDNVGAAF